MHYSMLQGAYIITEVIHTVHYYMGRVSDLMECMSDYQWWVAYNSMGLIDELISNLSYILPQVSLER